MRQDRYTQPSAKRALTRRTNLLSCPDAGTSPPDSKMNELSRRPPRFLSSILRRYGQCRLFGFGGCRPGLSRWRISRPMKCSHHPHRPALGAGPECASSEGIFVPKDALMATVASIGGGPARRFSPAAPAFLLLSLPDLSHSGTDSLHSHKTALGPPGFFPFSMSPQRDTR